MEIENGLLPLAVLPNVFGERTELRHRNQRWHRTMITPFCHPAFAVARQVVHHFAAVGRMADMHRTLEVEMFGQPRQVVGVMIHIMAAVGLGGAPMGAPVVGDHAEALAEEEQTWRLLRLGTLWSVEPRVVAST
jgi:hypothetical protein